jgi:methylated-DNA-protein-cysteine methyltransferase-like protein
MPPSRSHISLRDFLGSAAQRSKRRAGGPAHSPAVQAIWDVVAMIPAGKVASYGEVARRAGFPGRARQTGYALRVMPSELQLPWHRVLGAGGRIVFPKSSSSYREQVRRLKSEGVEVKAGQVDRSALLDA